MELGVVAPFRFRTPGDERRKPWRQASERSGFSGFTLHDLGHFYASGLIAAGCDVVTVQRALGRAEATRR